MGFIKILGSIVGLVAIFAPVFQAIRFSSRVIGRSSGRGAKYRSWQYVVLMTGGFIGIGIVLWKPLPLSIHSGWSSILFWMGSVLYFTGIGMYLWGFFALRSTFGVSSYTGTHLYAGHKLITHGPYVLVRHPMYLGVMMAALGATLIYRTWAMLVFLPMSGVVIKRARHEEKLLEEEFGEMWRSYALNTPRWIPRLLHWLAIKEDT